MTCQEYYELFRKIFVTDSKQRWSLTLGLWSLLSRFKKENLRKAKGQKPKTEDQEELSTRSSGGETLCLTSHCFRNVPVLCEILKVFRTDPWKDVHRRGYWCAGVSSEVVNDWIGSGPGSIKSNQA